MSTAPKARERAIRFTADEVRKLVGMTEVLLYKPIKLHQFHRSTTPGYDWMFRDRQGRWQEYREADLIAERCRFGKPGDRLWVQETWQKSGLGWGNDLPIGKVHYRATDNGEWKSYWGNWKPSVQMPRWASRLVFEIEHVGVQSLCSEDLWVLSLRRLEVTR